MGRWSSPPLKQCLQRFCLSENIQNTLWIFPRIVALWGFFCQEVLEQHNNRTHLSRILWNNITRGSKRTPPHVLKFHCSRVILCEILGATLEYTNSSNGHHRRHPSSSQKKQKGIKMPLNKTIFAQNASRVRRIEACPASDQYRFDLWYARWSPKPTKSDYLSPNPEHGQVWAQTIKQKINGKKIKKMSTSTAG